MANFGAARLNMVESQLRTNKVTDPALLEAFLDVPRERFVPAARRALSYADEDVPLGGGRFLMEPMVLGRMLQVAAVRPTDSVLEIASATGYATAILARLARIVVGVEEDAELAAAAVANLAALGCANATVRAGRLARGYPERAPYDVVLVSGAAEEVPPVLGEQLAEGGRLLAIVRPEGSVGHATLTMRTNGILSRRVIFDAATPVLPGLALQPSFVF